MPKKEALSVEYITVLMDVVFVPELEEVGTHLPPPPHVRTSNHHKGYARLFCTSL